ncbi:MAG: hypothetical protein RLZ23_445 [Actinomycetota bacterium]|jgi:hypothetical protein
MRVLGSAVLVMEFFVMGFAMLLAKDNHGTSAIIAGAVIALLLLLTPGLLKKRTGWILGSVLQIVMIGYAVVVPSMAIVGLIFGGLWIAAIVVGRRGEAIRAELMASRTPKP